jgi:hypothetical protein
MSKSVSVGMFINSPDIVVPSDRTAIDVSPVTRLPRSSLIPSLTKAPGGARDALGHVLRWGRAIAKAHRNFRPTVAASGIRVNPSACPTACARTHSIAFPDELLLLKEPLRLFRSNGRTLRPNHRGILLTGTSSHLRFRCEPIVKIVTVFSSAQFVQFVSSLTNSLLNFVWRLNRFWFPDSSGSPFFHSDVPPS